jgi:hypothetical protein
MISPIFLANNDICNLLLGNSLDKVQNVGSTKAKD